MLPLTSHKIYLLLAAILLPALSIPFIYSSPKKINPGWITSAIGLLQIGVGIYILLSVYQGPSFHQSWPWLILPHGLSIQIGIYIDLLSALLIVMVSFISWIVALYSITYLPAYTNFKRYFSLYSLSLTAMLWLLVADNLWGILLGWELLSMSSCLLIGFWYQTDAATQASTYAWGVSKLGSICFLVGILLIVVELGNCNLSALASVDAYTTSHLSSKILLAGYCLVIAALTKSAQFPFFSWLPHAMVATTPVSALLHTATVLSAGIYLLIRIQPILSPEVYNLLIIIGHLTAFMGTAAAWAQSHLKRMLAYSTVSHLGYVIAAIGLKYASLGVIYVVIHAFAKACLFLIAGVIARFLQNKGIAEKNTYTMSYMGGMWHHLPWVALSYLVAMDGLGILPGLVDLRAKESILAQTFVWAGHAPEGHPYYIIPLLALVSTGLTTLYMGQAFIRIFLGRPRWENLPPSSLPSPGSHPSFWLLQGSMVACAICILLVSYSLNNFLIPVTASPEGAWQSIVGYERIYNITQLTAYGLLLLVILWLLISRLKSTTWIAKAIPWLCNSHSSSVITAKAGTQAGEESTLYYGLPRLLRSLAMTFRELSCQLVGNTPRSFRQLFLHGWYLDACATFLTKQVLTCSRLATQIEKYLINGLIKKLAIGYIGAAHIVHWLDNQLIGGIGNGLAALSQQGSKLYLHLQSGRTQLYILWTCIGIGLLVIAWIVLI